jgi:hypothetical protein
MDLSRILVIVILLGIIASLGLALRQLTKTRRDSQKLLRALVLRIGLSVSLFLALFVAWYFGLIQPHGIGG